MILYPSGTIRFIRGNSERGEKRRRPVRKIFIGAACQVEQVVGESSDGPEMAAIDQDGMADPCDSSRRLPVHESPMKSAADAGQGTRRDAILYSVGANETHGLRRTNEDKRRAVLTLLSDGEWSKWSDREIARLCAVGHQMVAPLRAGLTGRATSERTYTTKHGTTATMNTSAIGKSAPGLLPPFRFIGNVGLHGCAPVGGEKWLRNSSPQMSGTSG
jgi:hypothetical protein